MTFQLRLTKYSKKAFGTLAASVHQLLYTRELFVASDAVMAKTTVDFRLPSALIEPGEYEVSIDGITAKIRIVLIPNREAMNRIMGLEANATGSGSVRLSRDRYGVVNISQVTIELPFTVDAKIDSTSSNMFDMFSQSAMIKRECLRFLNRLVEVERWNTRKYWITPIEEQEILHFTSLVEPDEGKPRMGMAMGLGGGQLHFPIVTLEEKNVEQEIKTKLASETELPFYDSLFLDAINYYETGRYNEALIVLNIALESFVADYLLSKLKEKGHSEEDAAKLVDKAFSREKKNRKSGMRKVLSEDFKEIDGRSLEDNSELWDTFGNARDKRKNVIHPRTTELTQEVALETMLDIVDVWRWVDPSAFPPSVTRTRQPTTVNRENFSQSRY
jgi:hypothetical protein